MKNVLTDHTPIDFFIPFGWTIHKNNVYDITFDTVNSYENDANKFNFLNTFFLDPIFFATAEFITNDNKEIKSTMSIGWNPEHEKEGKYSIYAEIRCGGKTHFEDSISSKDIFKIASEASLLMQKISNGEYER